MPRVNNQPNMPRKKRANSRRLGFVRKRLDSEIDGMYDVEIDTVDLPRKTDNMAAKSATDTKKEHEAMADDAKRNKLVCFTTDDFKIKRLVSPTTDLPLNKYTSLGAIFQNKEMRHTMSDKSYPVFKTPKDKMMPHHHILGPLTPGKYADVERTDNKMYFLSANVPPTQFPEAERPEASHLGRPTIGDDMWDPTKTPHDGVIWPMAWASKPPYATPGYQRNGAKQPVGVIQVQRVPIGQSPGNTESGTENLPTWVSPLYKSYGIGGPYGPFGPFYEPPHIDKVVTHDLLKKEVLERPHRKKCVIMRLWENFRHKNITATDKSLAMFMELLDEKLSAIRSLLRTHKKDDKEMLENIVTSLSTLMDEAKEFENMMDNREDDDSDLGE